MISGMYDTVQCSSANHQRRKEKYMKLPQKSSKFLLLGIMLGVCLTMTACNVQRQDKDDVVVLDHRALSRQESNSAKAEEISEIVCECLNEATGQVLRGNLETIQNIVSRLGENGYAAIDGENQIDMTNAEQVRRFCDAVCAEQTAELTMIQVIGIEHAGGSEAQENCIQGFQLYTFHTEDGMVEIDRSFYQYNDSTGKKFTVKDTVKYVADLWQYTQEGYLLFAGSYFSEDYYIVSLTDAPERVAIRVAPLDGQCRELNRKYIQPVGYACNNLFLANWDETDIGKLEIYDLFDRFYPMVYHQPASYVLDENPNKGAVYQIPQYEFEKVVQSHLNINSEALRSKTEYIPADGMYSYRPRGLYEIECTNQPYPEVVEYDENADGTITLTVNAVFPYECTAKAFSHKVTIRLQENGAFQYVSNTIIEGAYEAWWRTERLTGEEWAEIYGGQAALSAEEQKTENWIEKSKSEADDSFWYLPYADSCILSESERKELECTILKAAKTVSSVYQHMEIEQGTSYASNVKDFRTEQCQRVVKLLGAAGYISVSDDLNMENYEGVEAFYDAYTQARDALVTVYRVHSDGLLGAVTFIHQKGSLQTYYVGVDWKEGGTPYIKNTLVSDLSTINLTPKGYFIYTYQEAIVHSDANQYLRIRPLSERCRELTRKYIYGISFVNYDAFVTSWDSRTVEDILEPCLFDDIYRIHTKETIRVEDDRIASEVYERIMMTYFPVTREQLRRKCNYDAASDSYPYEMIFAVPYAPFGEVVDYTQNKDGTLTLIVDGVWIDRNMDCAFTNEIVVQPSADGTFRYLSNKCLSK